MVIQKIIVEFSLCTEVVYQPTDQHCHPLSYASSVAKKYSFNTHFLQVVQVIKLSYFYLSLPVGGDVNMSLSADLSWCCYYFGIFKTGLILAEQLVENMQPVSK